MGLPAERIERNILMPPASFRIVSGANTNEAFRDMHMAINAQAARFWGLRLESSGIVPHADTLQNRLTVMRKILVHAALDREVYPDKGQSGPKLVKQAQRIGQHKVPNVFEPRRSLGITYDEAHSTPEIRFPALNALLYEGEPVVELIRSLEAFRVGHPIAPNQPQQELGRLAFKSVLFSIGRVPYTAALTASANGRLA